MLIPLSDERGKLPDSRLPAPSVAMQGELGDAIREFVQSGETA